MLPEMLATRIGGDFTNTKCGSLRFCKSEPHQHDFCLCDFPLVNECLQFCAFV